MLRLLDLLFASFGLVVCCPLMACLYIAGRLDTGSPLLRQIRVGRHQQPFELIKFRTMRLDTQFTATHLASPEAVTAWGKILRQTKLDELPQLWNVLRGEMSLVGPRPCLPEQDELISERALRGVFDVRPGITGLAQINRIDMSTPRLLAKTDARMIAGLSVTAYLLYLTKTLLGAGTGDRIRRHTS